MLKSVKENCAGQLKTLKVDVLVPKNVPRHTYEELVSLLNKNNVQMKLGEDFNKENERKLGELLGEEAFFITDWPRRIKAFYAMPSAKDKEIVNAYDLMYRGLEISSGTQRIHDPNILIEQLKYHGLSPENFDFYVRAFRMGAPPHAGWSIGLERVTMQVCRLSNIREATLFPRDRHRVTP